MSDPGPLQPPPSTLQEVTALLGLLLHLGFMSEPWGAPEVTEAQPVGRAISRSWAGTGFSTRWAKLSLPVQEDGLVEFSSHYGTVLFSRISE